MSIDKSLTEARPDFDDAVEGRPYRSIAYNHDRHYVILDIFYDIGLRDIAWRDYSKAVKGYSLAFDLIANT